MLFMPISCVVVETAAVFVLFVCIMVEQVCEFEFALEGTDMTTIFELLELVFGAVTNFTIVGVDVLLPPLVKQDVCTPIPVGRVGGVTITSLF